MFYAHFVLSKKGPLARIWLAAHWDKKLTKAHVFETNISSSVDAILEPKVKMALRTSGHLLLGVVRIYSRKAKYLLADCNEAFVKIKMAFRPGVVDLPEDNREASVAAITLPETFHDFDTTMADLNEIDVQAQFTVNQSRPEEITMREELGNITLVGGDEGFGDIGFDEKEMMREASHMEESLYKNTDAPNILLDADKSKTNESHTEKPMDVDFNAPIRDDGFGGPLEEGLLDDGPAGVDHDDSSDDDDNFGGGVDHDLFGGDFMESGGLFEEPTPMADVSLAPEVSAIDISKATESQIPVPSTSAEQPAPLMPPPSSIPQPMHLDTTLPPINTTADQTTIVHNEDDAFPLEPLDITQIGTEKKTKRKRKLIVDDQKGIPSENMKLQLSDTSDIVTTLDLAPPTKKLMHWKETGGVEKLFALPGRPILSKLMPKVFTRNLTTKPVTDDEEPDDDRLELEVPELIRDDDHNQSERGLHDVSSVLGESHIIHRPRKSRVLPTPTQPLPPPRVPPPAPETPIPEPLPEIQQPEQQDELHLPTLDEALPPIEPLQIEEQQEIEPQKQPEEEEMVSDDIFSTDFQEGLIDLQAEGQKTLTNEEMAAIANTEEYEEKRLTKRSHIMMVQLERQLRNRESMTFQEFTRTSYRKQAASKFYTFLVLKKQEAINVTQNKPFGDIHINRGPKFQSELVY